MHPFSSLRVPRGKVGIHWFGQSSFGVKSPKGTVLLVDPYFPRERPPERFLRPESPLDEASLPADFVLLTHNHGDHTCIESIRRIHDAFPECRYLGPPESVANLLKNGIPKTLVTEVTEGDTEKLAEVILHVVWAKPPEGDPAAGIKPPDVQHLGFVLETGGVNVYVSGDPIHTFADHDELIAPVAACEPEIGLLTTHPGEGEFPFFEGSVAMAFKLGLKAVVPAHYQCFVKRNYDPAAYAALFPKDGPRPIVIPYNTAIVYPQAG